MTLSESALLVLQAEVESLSEEVVRLKALVREQDRAAGGTTLHVAIEWWDDRAHYVVTCPTQDELRVCGIAASVLAEQAMLSMIHVAGQCGVDRRAMVDALQAAEQAHEVVAP